MTIDSSDIRFIFFGHDLFSIGVLDVLVDNNFTPSYIVTGQDKPVGRKHTITPPPLKTWAETRSYDVLQPQHIDIESIPSGPWDVFIVASFGSILTKDVITLPASGTLNVHPSLLPDLRGPDPLRAALLTRESTGVSLMSIDEKVDHGPLLSQEKVSFPTWPVPYSVARDTLAKKGGTLLAKTIIPWIQGTCLAEEQDHAKATYTSKTTKQDGQIDLTDDPKANWRKYCAYETWPGTYFFFSHHGKSLRAKITEATFENGEFIIKKVIPEGKNEMLYSDFLRGIQN